MKKVILFVLSCCLITSLYAQNIVKEHYTVSGGLLGAANFSKFRIGNDNPSNIKYSTETGWAAGVWLNLPVSNAFSIEPQLMYSTLEYQTNSTTALLLNNGSISYVSLPILLKFHLGDKFAITAGPQVDFLTSIDDESNVAVKDNFKKTSLSAFGGIELFPHGRVTIFGRYVHGLTNMDDRGTEAPQMEYKNQNIQAGLKLKLFGKKVPADSDGDGVADNKDKCPNVVGVARYDGCPIPDTDGDGINDEQDKCPNQKGTAKYEGCPIPDKDGDGVNDEEDKCPDQAGPAARNGCPVSDRDNDGINDEEDNCPDVAGSASNRGCPDVPANVSKTLGASAQNISFGATNATLSSKSNASLNQVVKIMNENPTLKIRVEGHTDNAGNDEANMTLSQARADAVKAYLVKKGIAEDRIKSEGFGETMPIADNSTATGRANNRRIEIKVEY